MAEQPSVPKIALGVASGIALTLLLIPAVVVGCGVMIILLDVAGSILPDFRTVPSTIEVRNVEISRDPSGRPRILGEVFNGADRRARRIQILVDWLDAEGNTIGKSRRFVVLGKGLAPGGSQRFEIKGPRSPKIRDARCSIDPHWLSLNPNHEGADLVSNVPTRSGGGNRDRTGTAQQLDVAFLRGKATS